MSEFTKESLLARPQVPYQLAQIDDAKKIVVQTAEEIIDAIEEAEDHQVIIIKKGHYIMPRDCILTSHYVTIIGETGNRDDVILDSDMEYEDDTPRFKTRIGAPAIIKMTRAKNATVANLTLQNNPKYGILFLGEGFVNNLLIQNVCFRNIWARGLKGTSAGRYDDKTPVEGVMPITKERIAKSCSHNGEVKHCVFMADHAKRNDKDGFNGDYIAGMDLMHLDGWKVHDNIFIGIRGKNGAARGSVFIWQASKNLLIENNIFLDCDKAIGLGNPSGKDGKDYHVAHTKIIGNTIIGGCNKAIEVDFGKDVLIENNTISSDIRKEYPVFRVVDIVSNGIIRNNKVLECHGEMYQTSGDVTIED